MIQGHPYFRKPPYSPKHPIQWGAVTPELRMESPKHLIAGRWFGTFFMFPIPTDYPPVIKHGLLENGPFIGDFPQKTSVRGFSSNFSVTDQVRRRHPWHDWPKASATADVAWDQLPCGITYGKITIFNGKNDGTSPV